MTLDETVKVVAPATLHGGYSFDVVVDGETRRVTVPPGGVAEGETFDAVVKSDPGFRYTVDVSGTAAPDPEVTVAGIAEASVLGASTPYNPDFAAGASAGSGASAGTTTTKIIVDNRDGTQTITEETKYPDGRTTKTVTTTPASVPLKQAPQANPPVKPSPPTTSSADAPKGAWRHDLFSCFETCGDGMFWMAWCCTYIAMGQILQRMKMNVCGQPDPLNHRNTCMVWTILWIAACLVYLILVGVTGGLGVFIYYALVIVALVALTQARFHVRQNWSIPADCCEGNGCLSDCCCAYWCTCCTIIQMLRHTHDERVDRYNCGSATGLNEGAPEVGGESNSGPEAV